MIINTISDLKNVLSNSISISGNKSSIKETIYNNMLALSFSGKIIKSLRLNDLKIFLDDLLKNWNLQLLAADRGLQATFHIWFDRQALQLRFNIISGCPTVLPFDCKTKMLGSPDSILNSFIKVAHQVAIEGYNVEFFNFDEDVSEHQEEYILDVYRVT